MLMRQAAFDEPDAAALIAEAQRFYVECYGGEDDTPVDPAEFRPPLGLFVLGYVEDTAVACGGWRVHDSTDPAFADGDAEIKRMFVRPPARRRGLSRTILAELERTARAAGRRRMVLETGTAQPAAIALYISSGYTAIPKFGLYRDEPLSRCYGKTLTPTNGGVRGDLRAR